MASTIFIDKQTVVEASWLNDVNALTYSGTTPTGKTVATTDIISLSVDTISLLRAVDKTQFNRVTVFGYAARGDNGGGTYWYDSTDTTSADNGGTIIVATDGGRWKLILLGPLSVKQFGVKGDGTTDDSARIQAALDSFPSSGGELYFPSGTYKFSGITVTKPLKITCAGSFDGSVIWTNPSATAAFFTGSGITGFNASGFKATSSVTRTAGKYFDFTNANRIKITNAFIEKYFNAIGVDGGSEITFDSIQFFDGVDGATHPNSGAILLGDTNYTGSIGLNNLYIKCQNPSLQCTFGIRAKYVDVLTLGPNVTIIDHGKNFDIIPGNGQTASLIKSFGAIYDTADIGVNIVPTGSGKVIRSDFHAGWYGQHTVSGVVIDGSSGTVDGVSFIGGEAMNNSSAGVNIFGANTKNIVVSGMDIGGNGGFGIRLSTNADARLENNIIGQVGQAGANAVGIAYDNTVTGLIQENKFINNTTNTTGTAGANLSVFDNTGIDNWQSYTPTVTAQSGTFTTVSASGRYLKRHQTVQFEVTITVTTNGTAAGAVLVTLPVTTRVAFSGAGRAAGVSSKQLQVYAAGAVSQAVIYNYDGTYPASNGEVLVVTGTYEIL